MWTINLEAPWSAAYLETSARLSAAQREMQNPSSDIEVVSLLLIVWYA